MKQENEARFAAYITEIALGDRPTDLELNTVRDEIAAQMKLVPEEMHRADFYLAALNLAQFVRDEVIPDYPEFENLNDDLEDTLHEKCTVVAMRLRSIILTNPHIELPLNVAYTVRAFDHKIPVFSRVYRGMVGLPQKR